MNPIYVNSARLLTKVAPLVLVDDTFALKGGTAINLFVRDMPRLSADLDLVFPDHMLPREAALRRINEAIRQSVARLKKQGFQTHAPASADAGETKLLVRQGAIEVKIEVNFVMCETATNRNPPPKRHKELILPAELVRGWGPDRRRSGPHHPGKFEFDFSTLSPFSGGVPVPC